MFGTGVHKREIDDIMETNYQHNFIRTQSNGRVGNWSILAKNVMFTWVEINWMTSSSYRKYRGVEDRMQG